MKRVFKSFVAIVALATITTVSSCTKTCDEGYEGDDCKTEVREKFIGQYQGSEICTAGTDNYTVTVAKSGSDIVKITISNVYNQGFTASASVDGSSFTVESQTVGSNTTVSGSGSVSGTNLTFTYTVVSPAATNSCTFTGTRL